MASHIFKLPDVGEGIVEAEIGEWYVRPGDVVTADQAIVDIMTEKAAVELTAPVAGTVISVAGNSGDMIAVGAELIRFEIAGGSVAAEDETPTPVQPVAPDEIERSFEVAEITGTSSLPIADAKPLASPSTRRRAREAGADLRHVSGSGRGGRILREDLDQFLEKRDRTPSAQAITPVQADIEIALRGIRRQIANKMSQSKRSIPHFSYVEEVDVTELEVLRRHLNNEHGEARGKLSYLPFLMLALVRVLRKFPQCNSTYNDETEVITQHGAIDIGIATKTDSGLKVPVVRRAESRNLWDAAREMKRVTQAARDNSAKLEELKGSTITISSLGALGGIMSTPIINAPEVSIIGVNKSVQRVMVFDGGMKIRRMMNLSSSFDHRIVDGYDAAAMIQQLKVLLEHPATIFI